MSSTEKGSFEGSMRESSSFLKLEKGTLGWSPPRPRDPHSVSRSLEAWGLLRRGRREAGPSGLDVSTIWARRNGNTRYLLQGTSRWHSGGLSPVCFQAQCVFQYQCLLTKRWHVGRECAREFSFRYPPKGVVGKAQNFESNDTGLNHS